MTLALYNVTLTSKKPCSHNNTYDCNKTNGLNEVDVVVFSIKYRYSDILLKKHKLKVIQEPCQKITECF